MKTNRLRLIINEIVKFKLSTRYLHIEVRDDDLAKYAQQEPRVESVISGDFVRIECVKTVAECQAAEEEVNHIAAKECLLDSIHRGVSINFSQLGHDEFTIEKHIRGQPDLIQQIQCEERRENFTMM